MLPGVEQVVVGKHDLARLGAAREHREQVERLGLLRLAAVPDHLGQRRQSACMQTCKEVRSYAETLDMN